MSDVTEFRPSTGMDTASISAQGYGMVQYGPSDDKLIVGFYRRSVLNQAKSREVGKPVHEGRDFVKIQHPGETLNVVDRPVNPDDDPRRWPRQWHLYQQGVKQVPDGVPINLLFPTKPEIETTLRGYNIHTVEQLANLSSQGIQTVGMGSQDWVNAAQRYMERANKGVDHHKFESALREKDQQIATLTRQIAEVTALVRQQAQQPQYAPNETPAVIRNMGRASAPALPDLADYDYQTAQINTTHQSADDSTAVLQPPVEFLQDLSGQVSQPKARGWPKGKPRGSRKH